MKSESSFFCIKGRWTHYAIDTLHEVYLSKAAPTLRHLKLRGRDQWEVRKQITGAAAKEKKNTHTQVKMEI